MTPTTEAMATELQWIPIDLLDRHPDYPRLELPAAGIARLAAALGSEYPPHLALRVRRAGDRFQIIGGVLRHEAARQNGLTRVLARVEDFETDLDLLRRRYQELRDAPPLADADRLPARDAVNHLIQFNRSYRTHLEGRQVWEADRADVIGVALAETDRLYKVWDAVRDARCEFYYVTVRRQALKRLREALGDAAYGTAELPPHVPAWRFREAR